MNWQLMFGFLVVVNIGSTFLTKLAANVFPKREIGVFFQYLCAFLITIPYFVLSHLWSGESMGVAILMVAMVGIFNALGNLAGWEAYALSLGKSSLLEPFFAIVPMILALIFLQEIIFWTPLAFVGIIFCLTALFLFGFGGLKRKWFFYATIMVLSQGIAAFLIKLFSFTVPREDFLLGWYGGSWLTMVLFLVIKNKGRAADILSVPKKKILLTFFLSATTVGALFFLYWVYQLGGPVSIVNPLLATLITIAGILLGWFFFKERGGLSKPESLGFLLGIAGAMMVFWK